MTTFFDKLIGKNDSPLETVTELNYLHINDEFVASFVRNIYSKILHECADRALIPEEVEKDGYTITVYDSFSPYKKGLVTWIVDTLVKGDRVYLRKTLVTGSKIADVWLFEKINATVEKIVDGDVLPPDIIELDFRQFTEARAIGLLFLLLKAVLESISKGVTMSGALLLKIHKLSEMIANDQNLKPLAAQITQINEGLKDGNGAYVDAMSSVDFPKYDSKPATETVAFIFSMMSSLTGLPNSYLFGEVVSSLGGGDSGDATRMNAAIKKYYFSIFNGCIYAVYDKTFNYKNIIDDVDSMVDLFAFIETTTLLTNEAKVKFLVNHSGFDTEDFQIINPTAKVIPEVKVTE